MFIPRSTATTATTTSFAYPSVLGCTCKYDKMGYAYINSIEGTAGYMGTGNTCNVGQRNGSSLTRHILIALDPESDERFQFLHKISPAWCKLKTVVSRMQTKCERRSSVARWPRRRRHHHHRPRCRLLRRVVYNLSRLERRPFVPVPLLLAANVATCTPEI